jgi:dihydroxyacetone kinase-like protein
MDIAALSHAVGRVAATMQANRDHLIQLDQQNGDGDLGITMAAGYKAIAEHLASTPEKDLGRALMKCSSIFNETAPSTLGTITSLGLMALAKALKGKTEADTAEIALAMEAMLAAIMEKAKSKPGDKTILDSLAPAIAALKEHSAEGPEAAFGWAAKAAAAGSEATRAMRSVHGRAAYYGDKSIGVIDGGSVVGALIFESLHAACAERAAQ